jgi:hypothetical protein
MQSRNFVALALAATVSFGCAPHDPLTPTAKEQKQLDAQVERVFAGIDAPEADREAVQAVHRLAYWIRSYHAKTDRYPLADHVGDVTFVQVVVYGNDSYVDYDNPVNLPRDLLLEDLRAVLGNAVDLPEDPDPTDPWGLHYSTSGRGFVVACDLQSPVNGGEMVSEDQAQYRVASYANDTLPILDFEAILTGKLASLPPVHWRDPTMAR